MSDHYGIYSVLSFKQPRLPSKFIKIRYYNNMNVESFIDDICNHDIFNITLSDIVTVDDLVTNWNTWLSTLNEIVDKHAPLRNIRVKNRSNPWFNNNIQQAIYSRNYYHERALKHNDINSWNKYRECRNYVTSLIRKYKCDYYYTAIANNSNNSKQMWKTLKTILPSKSNNNCSEFSSNDFNTYFATIGNNLESQFNDNIVMPDFEVPPHNNYEFDDIPLSYIVSELLTLSSKSSPDVLGLSGTILCIAAHSIAPSLYVLFNKSLGLGHVPRDWKLARVTPLYKGKGSKSELGSYRPISVISHVPKIIEKFVCHSFNKYLTDNSLLHNDQFAYRKSQSTVNAVHTLIDTTLSNIDQGMLTGLVQLDLTKGFDLVNHKILLFKLNKYGVVNNCLSWFDSYLSDRQQLVCYNGNTSDICNLSIGVPQGTILGPTLFVLYINDFSNNIGPAFCIRYADDTSIVACDYNITALQSKLQASTEKATEWLTNNRLLVNSNKCSCMLIGSRQRIKNLSLNIYILRATL